LDFDKDTNTKSTMSIWKSQEEEKLNQEFYNF